MKLQACWRLAAVLFAIPVGAVGAEDKPQFALPLACEPHKTCFIQNYVDIDSTSAIKDYACGGATYDQHSGVDFRLLSAAAAKAGVAVRAAADGTVKGMRDGVDDVFFKAANRANIAGRECGNGVLIDHGSGWETQYCHMKKGSVHVAKGQAVKKGDQIGDVGYSGMAEFAHVHLTVRHNGKIIDPFLPDAADGACVRDAKGAGLWEPSVAAAFPYKNGEIIGSGFVGAPPDFNALEADHSNAPALATDSAALLVYGRFINLLSGDRIHLSAKGPQGQIVDEVTPALARNKASYVAFAGKKRGEAKWASGHYEGAIELLRGGAVVATAPLVFDLQ